MKKYLKVSTFMVFISLGAVALTAYALAATQVNSGLLPPEIYNILNLLGPGGICAADYINSRARLALFMVLGLLILISVVYALLAAFKYIRSEGDPGKMEEAQKSIKAIFFGIAAMLIAIVGIVLVFIIFGAKPTNPNLFQTCVNAINSQGCVECQKSPDAPKCTACEQAYADICSQSQGKTVVLDDILNQLPADCQPTNLKK